MKFFTKIWEIFRPLRLKKSAAATQIEFKTHLWQEEINLRDFIFNNITAYDGDASFLASAAER
jgi:pyruvate-formate lyase